MVGDRAIGRRALPLTGPVTGPRSPKQSGSSTWRSFRTFVCFIKFPAVHTSSEACYTARATSNTNGAASSHSVSVHTLCEVFIAVTRSPWAAATSSNLAIAAST